MDPLEPVALHGDLVTIEPLRADHDAGLLAAADDEEIFAWLPYPRPADIAQARSGIEEALADRRVHRRFSSP
jgi:N-acetyltransferase